MLHISPFISTLLFQNVTQVIFVTLVCHAYWCYNFHFIFCIKKLLNYYFHVFTNSALQTPHFIACEFLNLWCAMYRIYKLATIHFALIIVQRILCQIHNFHVKCSNIYLQSDIWSSLLGVPIKQSSQLHICWKFSVIKSLLTGPLKII